MHRDALYRPSVYSGAMIRLLATDKSDESSQNHFSSQLLLDRKQKNIYIDVQDRRMRDFPTHDLRGIREIRLRKIVHRE